MNKEFQRRTYSAQVRSVFAMKLVKAQLMVILRKSRNKHGEHDRQKGLAESIIPARAPEARRLFRAEAGLLPTAAGPAAPPPPSPPCRRAELGHHRARESLGLAQGERRS